MDSSVSGYLQRYQDRINALSPAPVQNYQTGGLTSMPNAATNYSMNNDYALGSRTYNGSSPSPQAGPGSVNPAGYATRDNLAKTKNNLLAGYVNQGA